MAHGNSPQTEARRAKTLLNLIEHEGPSVKRELRLLIMETVFRAALEARPSRAAVLMTALTEDELQKLKAANQLLHYAIQEAQSLVKWRVYKACPRCGVDEGDPCMTDGLNVKDYAHVQREKIK